MYLDTTIKPTKHTLWIQGVFLLLVFLMLFLAKVAWWQYGTVMILVALCFYVQHIRHVPLVALSVDDVKEIWYLGMYDEDEPEVWQGYLSHAQFVNLWAVRLTFYVVVPFEMKYSVVIDKGGMSGVDFAKLKALARFF
ncbi:hypothetical protein [Moraxella oblonga]|uniref:hypothetical protein n=1 Tax=Moraxella oblonga TaxID=200413 RepID=UPI00083148DD|nr:hypothetical protein [Moraxella oblonga]